MSISLDTENKFQFAIQKDGFEETFLFVTQN